MKTRDRIKFQKQLVNDLMDWKFNRLGYSKDLKEMNIYNDTFLYPFYAATSRGPFFTFRPSLRVKSKSLLAEINSITRYQLLYNCIFSFGERLNRHLGIKNVRGYLLEENIEKDIAYSYRVRIDQVDDYEWVLGWFKHYISEVCVPLENQISEPTKLYFFLKNIFENQVAPQRINDIRELMNSFELSIAHSEIITMIYLGFKFELDGISELARKATNYKEGPLYHEPIMDLINYFEK